MMPVMVPRPPHPPLAGYTVHTIAGWCQCRCDDCYWRLLGCCWCLSCICEDEYDANHDRLARAVSVIDPMRPTLVELDAMGTAAYFTFRTVIPFELPPVDGPFRWAGGT